MAYVPLDDAADLMGYGATAYYGGQASLPAHGRMPNSDALRRLAANAYPPTPGGRRQHCSDLQVHCRLSGRPEASCGPQALQRCVNAGPGAFYGPGGAPDAAYYAAQDDVYHAHAKADISRCRQRRASCRRGRGCDATYQRCIKSAGGRGSDKRNRRKANSRRKRHSGAPSRSLALAQPAVAPPAAYAAHHNLPVRPRCAVRREDCLAKGHNPALCDAVYDDCMARGGALHARYYDGQAAAASAVTGRICDSNTLEAFWHRAAGAARRCRRLEGQATAGCVNDQIHG